VRGICAVARRKRVHRDGGYHLSDDQLLGERRGPGDFVQEVGGAIAALHRDLAAGVLPSPLIPTVAGSVRRLLLQLEAGRAPQFHTATTGLAAAYALGASDSRHSAVGAWGLASVTNGLCGVHGVQGADCGAKRGQTLLTAFRFAGDEGGFGCGQSWATFTLGAARLVGNQPNSTCSALRPGPPHCTFPLGTRYTSTRLWRRMLLLGKIDTCHLLWRWQIAPRGMTCTVWSPCPGRQRLLRSFDTLGSTQNRPFEGCWPIRAHGLQPGAVGKGILVDVLDWVVSQLEFLEVGAVRPAPG
jgi:hypothetical protein